MAQSVRRPETLGAMDREPQRDKTRTSYFGNVKTRSGLVNCLDYWGEKKGGKALSRHVTSLAAVCSSDLRSYNQLFHHSSHISAQNAHFPQLLSSTVTEGLHQIASCGGELQHVARNSLSWPSQTTPTPL